MTGRLNNYFPFAIALIHLAQAKTLLPESKPALPAGRRTHCKFGYFLFLMVGLYFPRSLISLPTILVPFPQIAHCFAMNLSNL